MGSIYGFIKAWNGQKRKQSSSMKHQRDITVVTLLSINIQNQADIIFTKNKYIKNQAVMYET